MDRIENQVKDCDTLHARRMGRGGRTNRVIDHLDGGKYQLIRM